MCVMCASLVVTVHCCGRTLAVSIQTNLISMSLPIRRRLLYLSAKWLSKQVRLREQANAVRCCCLCCELLLLTLLMLLLLPMLLIVFFLLFLLVLFIVVASNLLTDFHFFLCFQIYPCEMSSSRSLYRSQVMEFHMLCSLALNRSSTDRHTVHKTKPCTYESI